MPERLRKGLRRRHRARAARRRPRRHRRRRRGARAADHPLRWRGAARRLPPPHLGGLRPTPLPDAPQDVVDFILATQPKTWAAPASQHHGDEIEGAASSSAWRARSARRGTLDVLRQRGQGLGLQAAHRLLPAVRAASTRSSSASTAATSSPSSANCTTARRTTNSLDLALFLNGLPLFTAELKKPADRPGPSEDAIKQYKTDRDPREPAAGGYGRCLAHFAVDPDLVYVTTRLAGGEDPLPAVQPAASFGGAGNPAVPPTRPGLRHRLPVATGCGRATACSTWCASSSTR